MENKVRADNRIVEGVIWKELLRFFFPILLGTFFQQLYNTVDAIVIGQYGSTQALAAVGGSSAMVINLIIGFFVGLSSGVAVMISQYYGANEPENVSKSVHTAMWLALVMGAVVMVLGLVCAGTLLGWMNTPEDVMEDSVIYLRIVFFGIIPAMVYNVGSGILRAVGDSKRPLYFLITCCVINIVLDILFVAVFRWGVAGVAIATTLAQLLSAVLVVLSLCRAKDCYRLEIRKIRADKRILHESVRIGIPSGIQSMMYSLSNTTITTVINGFQTRTVAAWVALGKIDALNWMIVGAFGTSIMTFVGQNYGARKYSRVRRSIRVCGSMSIVMSMLFGAALLLGGQYIYRLFSKDTEVIEIAMQMTTYFAPIYWLYVPIEVISGSLRGMGDTMVSTIITALGICVFRVIWMFTVVPIWHTIFAVSISYPISWFLCDIAFVIYYLLRRGKIYADLRHPELIV